MNEEEINLVNKTVDTSNNNAKTDGKKYADSI